MIGLGINQTAQTAAGEVFGPEKLAKKLTEIIFY